MQVLVVEDEAKIANILQRGLRMNSYNVDIAADAVVVADGIELNDYDLIILDLKNSGA